ncbi:TonB-dependent receptor domain-containing protein [Spongorhabdus nitratireducens]
MQFNKLSLCIGLSIALANTTYAGSSDKQTPLQLQPVVVTATKTEANLVDIPQSVSVMTDEQISEMSPDSVYEVLEWMPGVSISSSNPYYAQPSVRGLSGARVVINIDGLNQTMDSTKGMELSPFNIDPFLIKQVEVQKGASSVLYGSGGLGGVIALKTKTVDDLLQPGQSVGGFVRSQFGDLYDSLQTTAGAYGRTDKGEFDWLVTGTKYRDDRGQNGSSSKNDNHKFSSTFGWNPDADQRLALKLEMGKRDYINKTLVNPDKAEDKRAQLNYDLKRGDHINLKALLGYSEQERKASMVNASAGQQDTDVKRIQFDLQNSHFLVLGPTDHEVTYGANGYQVEQKGTVNGKADSFIKPEGKRRETALFLQDRIDWSDFTFIAAVRQNQYRMTSSANGDVKRNDLLPSAGVTYRATDWLSLHANYSEDFRAPTVDELYTTKRYDNAPIDIIANPNLKPETSKNKEYGLTLHHAGLFTVSDEVLLRATYFDQDIKDMITVAFLRVNPDTNRREFGSINKASVNRTGFEVEAQYRYEQVSFAVAADSVKEKDKITGDTDDHPDTLKLKLTYSLPQYAMKMSWLGRAAERNKRNKTEYAGYMTHDFRVVMNDVAAIKGTEVSFALNNAFNREYRTNYGATGEKRNFHVGLAYKF